MTKANFLDVLLRNLGRIQLGQSASSSDATAITVVYDSVFNSLQNDGLVSWGLTDDLPAWAIQPMKKLVSAEAASEFVTDDKRLYQLKSEERAGFVQLLQGMNQDYSPETYPAEYF